MALPTDGGGEYRSLHSFLDQHGLKLRQTCPYTFEQNGIAERKHRHIVETGLTLLAQAGIPLPIVTEAFSAAVHLISRLLSPLLQHRSPFEAI